MIPGTAEIRQVPAWQQALAQVITDPAELLEVLDLGPEWLEPAKRASTRFPLRVPRGYVARMQPGNPYDPLLRQVLPLAEEQDVVQGFTQDPVGDLSAIQVPGVLEKYRGRVLLTATGACAVHCRYCFRRHFPYPSFQASINHWEEPLAFISGDPEVEEVILSGGDPLTLSDRRLQEFVQALTNIPHVHRLRVHTRLPIVLPERVTPELSAILGGTRLMPVVVVHANHANEIDAGVKAACQRLARDGVMLFNQSVLLRGVNDSVEALATLSSALAECRVVPYYLHLLDRVQGAAHFEVPEGFARELHRELMERMPGYLVPRLVREVPDAPFKVPV